MTMRWLVPLTALCALCALAGCDVSTSYCGNGICEASRGETAASCPADCATSYVCGNGICEASRGETAASCPADCATGYVCGNGICEASLGETAASCPADCATSYVCGNGACEDTKGETCANCAQDCGSCPVGAAVNVYWNINGTVDGTDKGASWDTCDEVSATTVTVSVDSGAPKTFNCTGTVPGKMSGSVSVTPGQHNLAVTLNSASGPLTTTATGSVTVSATTPAEFFADFFFGAFLTIKSSMTGSYLFDTSYEGKSCTQTTPQVFAQVTLLKLNGTAVTAQVCGPDASCFASDGATFGKCYAPQQTQTIAGLKWGFYKFKIQGTLGSSTGYDICWETLNDGPQLPDPWPIIDNKPEVDILVGAGSSNPIIPIDLVRISTTGFCM